MGKSRCEQLPIERGLLIGAALAEGARVTARSLQDTYGLSRPTAQRLMRVIETTLRCERATGDSATGAGHAVLFLRRAQR